MNPSNGDGRRSFLHRALGLVGLSAAANSAASAQNATTPAHPVALLPDYARTMNHRSLKQSSHDRTGGNADRWVLEPGATQEVFNSNGPGVISHI